MQASFYLTTVPYINLSRWMRGESLYAYVSTLLCTLSFGNLCEIRSGQYLQYQHLGYGRRMMKIIGQVYTGRGLIRVVCCRNLCQT